MTDYKTSIVKSLVKLGVSEGDSLLVHASLNSVGHFENRAQILIDTFIQVLGPSGTLLMPALSYENVTSEFPIFDVLQTPSCVGALTEYFRNRPGTSRSIHPTHSVCATGKRATFFLKDHHLDHTPCGPSSPFRKLMENEGKILFLGCGLKPNTSMHGIEELSEPEYLLGEKLNYSIITEDDESYQKEYITHNFKGYEQRYDRVLNILDEDDYSTGHVLDAEVWLLKTRPLWDKAHKKLLEEPLYFVDKMSGK